MVDIARLRRFCNGDFSKIENYEKAIKSDETYECHHRLETHFLNGERLIKDFSRDELINMGLYYHRPPEELIYLTKAEHRKIHWCGKKHTKLHRLHNSEGQKARYKVIPHRKHTKEEIEKMVLKNYKKIKCLEFGFIFNSCKEAAEWVGKTQSTLSTALSHPTRTCGGFHWEFVTC